MRRMRSLGMERDGISVLSLKKWQNLRIFPEHQQILRGLF
jgi:hypothetical protein